MMIQKHCKLTVIVFTIESAKLSEKNLSLGPWDVIRDLFNGPTYKATPFHQKTDLYFQDYQLIPLMVQENYPKVQPALVKEKHLTSILAQDLETLNCLSHAADAISDSDLLDSAIRK
jgi:replication factor C subunit 1